MYAHSPTTCPDRAQSMNLDMINNKREKSLETHLSFWLIFTAF